jgi:hypothetical protein
MCKKRFRVDLFQNDIKLIFMFQVESLCGFVYAEATPRTNNGHAIHHFVTWCAFNRRRMKSDRMASGHQSFGYPVGPYFSPTTSWMLDISPIEEKDPHSVAPSLVIDA